MGKQLITEKYRPKHIKDLIGNTDKIETVITNIKNGTPVFIHGLQGIGKTSSVFAIANDLKYDVIYVNASDERTKDKVHTLYVQCIQKPLTPTIICIDEIDGFRNWSALEKICKNTKNPVVLIANKYWVVPKHVRDLTTVVEYKQPYVKDVKKLVDSIAKKEHKQVSLKGITRDVRSSLLSTFSETDPYVEINPFDICREVFEDGKVDNFDFKENSIWLVDNIPQLYNGIQMYKAYQTFLVAITLNETRVLKYLPRTKGQIVFPPYLHMLKNVKKQDDDEETSNI